MSQESGNPPAKMQDCNPAAQRGPQHDSIARFEGTWKAEVRIWMDPSSDPMVSTGTMKNTMILNGFFLEHVYEDDAGYFSGRGFWGYNHVDQRYEGLWIDVMATCLQIDNGQHDSAHDTYTMTGTVTDPMSHRPMKRKSIIRYTDANHHSVEMFIQKENAPEVKVMEIRYARKA